MHQNRSKRLLSALRPATWRFSHEKRCLLRQVAAELGPGSADMPRRCDSSRGISGALPCCFGAMPRCRPCDRAAPALCQGRLRPMPGADQGHHRSESGCTDSGGCNAAPESKPPLAGKARMAPTFHRIWGWPHHPGPAWRSSRARDGLRCAPGEDPGNCTRWAAPGRLAGPTA